MLSEEEKTTLREQLNRMTLHELTVRFNTVWEEVWENYTSNVAPDDDEMLAYSDEDLQEEYLIIKEIYFDYGEKEFQSTFNLKKKKRTCYKEQT